MHLLLHIILQRSCTEFKKVHEAINTNLYFDNMNVE